jgi:hypothetical protein
MTNTKQMSGKSIEHAVRDLLQIVARLQLAYPRRRFTLDGHLVGDIGEVLAEQFYDIKLNEGLQKHHDAISSDNRNVQIKATMKTFLTFPADHVPDYYLGVQISHAGEITEIYNGPANPIADYLKRRKTPKDNSHNLSFNIFRKLNKIIDTRDRIPERA